MGMVAVIHSGLEDLAEKEQDREAGKPVVVAREKPVMNPGVQAGRGKSGEEGSTGMGSLLTETMESEQNWIVLQRAPTCPGH